MTGIFNSAIFNNLIFNTLGGPTSLVDGDIDYRSRAYYEEQWRKSQEKLVELEKKRVVLKKKIKGETKEEQTLDVSAKTEYRELQVSIKEERIREIELKMKLYKQRQQQARIVLQAALPFHNISM